MFLGIAKAVQACHNDLLTMMQQSHDVSVAEFLLQNQFILVLSIELRLWHRLSMEKLEPIFCIKMYCLCTYYDAN